MNNSEQSFQRDIAALEGIMDSQSNQYYTTPVLQGKKWYGLGLEDNEANNQKDDTNKKGIIRKMFDTVLAFIGRIITRVKEFFTGKKKDNVDTEKVFKEYNGPTDEATAQSFSDFARDYAKKQEQSNKEMADHTAKMKAEMEKDAEEHKRAMETMAKDTEKLKAMAEKMRKEAADVASRLAKAREVREKLEKSLNEVAKETGKVPSAEDVKEIAEAQMIDKFFARHRYQTTTWFVMTLRDDFVKQYRAAYDAYEDVISLIEKDASPDSSATERLQDAVDACRAMQEKHRLTEKKDLIETVTKVVKGDSDLNNYSGMYLHNSGGRIKEMDSFYKKAKAKFESIQDTASMEDVTAYRKTMMATGQYLMLFTNISDWAHEIARVLKPGG